jgi:anthranilate synthase component 1
MTQTDLQQAAAAGHSHMPVVRSLLADVDTPVSVYLKLANQPYSYLFESVEGGERWGRYSIIGLPCAERVEIRGQQITHVTVAGSETIEHENPLDWVDEYRQTFSAAPIANQLPDMPMLTGGLVGYFGHETIGYIEKRFSDVLVTGHKADDIGAPDILLLLSTELVVFDNLSGRMHLIVHADTQQADGLEQAQARLDELETALGAQLPDGSRTELGNASKEDQFVSSFGEQAYKDTVEHIRQYITDGDAMQVVPSQQLSADFDGDPINVYRALRTLNPSPYMYYLHMDDFHVAGASPEILVRAEGDEITVRPIAGTRKRGATPEEDLALEEELLADPKEVAEHLMLIDLGRNDVGRVSNTKTVVVSDQMVVERYSHVMHIVSNVKGQMKAGMGPIDALKATFPAGTLSGAPKIRALEIIDEVEPVKRGIYGGAVGYIAWNGDMDTAIAIRTAVIKNGKLYAQAGAGVVYDSKPQLEWDETMNKARAVMTAAGMAQGATRGTK